MPLTYKRFTEEQPNTQEDTNKINNIESQIKEIEKTLENSTKTSIFTREMILSIIISVCLSFTSMYIYSKYFKKYYVVDYTAIINKAKSEIENAATRGDQLVASIKLKQLVTLASETDIYCKNLANQLGAEIFAANLVFAPNQNIVDLTPQLVKHLQSKNLIEGNITDVGQVK